MFTLNCRGKLLSLSQPVVMGIINATPDSFYTGLLPEGIKGMTALAGKMLSEGAAILDIGGQSTRPGSTKISAAEEIQRVVPVIESILATYPGTLIAVDTYYSEVAGAAAAAGASIINDISAGELDSNMLSTVAALKAPYIAMHMKGNPQNMQQQAQYDNVVTEVLDYFIRKTAACAAAGIADVIIDPGFGFSKTIAHNFQLLKHLQAFGILNKPVLAGLSRKSTIYKTLQTDAAGALNGTTCLNTIALLNGAQILRVHDVKEAIETIVLVGACNSR